MVQQSYKKFTTYFHNPEIQNNIRDAKEEQFQEGFLRELFVNILGYVINPEPAFNLTTEFKNLTGAKKADGAILQDRKALAVVELKGTETRDLDKISGQAFNYKNNQPDCVYVVTSNFEKLRFFIHNSVDHLEFNLFTLTENEFQLLWLCLAAESLLKGIPAKIKEESSIEEENITKYLYRDYASFRTDLWQNMVLNNPQVDQLILFRKTQKLLDRFLFVFFAEDSGLLPPNSISRMVERWQVLKDEDAYKPLYDIFRQFFGYINTGRKGKTTNDDIFEFNGGLFLPDEILDTIRIDDLVLQTHTMKLSAYDFQSEVDVNILGHIFENSLSEIENVKAQIEGQETDKSKSKRKKDGIFYTPRYITKYIVENTLGKLCEEKKAEHGIIDEEYAKGRKNRKKETLLKLDEQLQAYRQWLLNITICDPACGSGAFLNQALEFLIEEHQYLDELQAQLLGSSFIFPDVENHILEKNIFGVDINDESVEIARLSLWLRTAQRGRKLTSLNNNIKCGNSLIDDPAIAGDKAFNWPNEFPEVFARGGFDIIIGNPPYGAKISNSEKSFYNNFYKTRFPNYDSYGLFFEKSYQILKASGYLGFITPNTYLVIENGVELRKLLFRNCRIVSFLETFNVFQDAVVEPITTVLSKEFPKSDDSVLCFLQQRGIVLSQIDVNNCNVLNFPYSELFERDDLIFNYRASEQNIKLSKKICKNAQKFGDITKVTAGVKPYEKNKGNPLQTDEIVEKKPYTSFEKRGDDWLKLIRGTQVNRYLLVWDGEYIKYGDCLAAPRNPDSFYKPKIFIRRTDDKILSVYDDTKIIGLNSIHCLRSINDAISLKFLLSILNSKLINWFFQFQNFHMIGKPLAEVKVVFIERLPIKIPINQSAFIEKADIMLSLNKELQALSNKFSSFFSGQYKLTILSGKLENWYDLEFPAFISELNKAIKTAKGNALSKKDEFEWIDLFNENKQKALALKSEIDKTDKKIDNMVYELYGLTDQEVKIVEGT